MIYYSTWYSFSIVYYLNGNSGAGLDHKNGLIFLIVNQALIYVWSEIN